MGLSLQRKLELAGDLARVQLLLQRLHVIERPKKRRPVRSLIVAGSIIALGTVVAAVVFGRKCCQTSTPADLRGFAHSDTIADASETLFEPGAPEEPSAETPG